MVNPARDVARNHGGGCLSGNSDQVGAEASRKAAADIDTPLRARVRTDMHHDARQSHSAPPDQR
jgi:hypothetical protein